MSVRDLFDLGGRVAIVTGGSRGLGYQIAEGLGEAGATVCIVARKRAELDEARDRLAAKGIRAVAHACDVGQVELLEPLVDRVLAEHAQVDIVVNNAGATWGAPMEEYPWEIWDKLFRVNLMGVFALTQLCGRKSMLPRRHGKVINVASIAGGKGSQPDGARFIGYQTTKGGQINFTRGLAGEWGRYNINVNAICPGYFPTRMSGSAEGLSELNARRAPLQRNGGDEDLKGLAVLLASEAGRHITGQVIAVDGGVSAV